jgi:hypothetical protein
LAAIRAALKLFAGREQNFGELSFGMVQQCIQDWLDTQLGFPCSGDEGE